MNRQTNHKRLLLLTATVTPHPRMSALAVRGPEERFQQYRDAFEFLVSSGVTSLFDRVLLCENSGFPLDRFDDVFSRSEADVVYVPVLMDESAGKYGRGYSEMLLIDTALQQAADLISDDDRVWKLTGRYKVKNLAKVVTRTDASADLVVTLRRFPSKWADLYLFGFNRKAWSGISSRLEELKAASGSVVMYDVIDDLPSRGVSIRHRLATEPQLMGVRGHDQRNYDTPRQRLKRRVRLVLHGIAPGLRI